ncbi:MAG: hypothetical protein ABIG95_05250 [Candidatus Woesearchaeota archaeon]
MDFKIISDLFLELTYACSGGCAICSNPSREGFLTFEQVEQIPLVLNGLSTPKLFNIVLSGGDPLFYYSSGHKLADVIAVLQPFTHQFVIETAKALETQEGRAMLEKIVSYSIPEVLVATSYHNYPTNLNFGAILDYLLTQQVFDHFRLTLTTMDQESTTQELQDLVESLSHKFTFIGPRYLAKIGAKTVFLDFQPLHKCGSSTEGVDPGEVCDLFPEREIRINPAGNMFLCHGYSSQKVPVLRTVGQPITRKDVTDYIARFPEGRRTCAQCVTAIASTPTTISKVFYTDEYIP